MREVRSSIERIDIPTVIAALIVQSLLFPQNVVRRPLLRDAFANQFFRRRSAAVTRSASPLYSIFKC